MIGAAIQKDVWLLLRDRGALISLFVLPIIFIVVFGSMFRFGGDGGKPRPSPIWHAPGDARPEAAAMGKPPPMEEPKPPGIARSLEHITSFQVAVPGNAVLFGFFIALTTAMAFVTERRTGTWRRLLAAPVPRWKALLATLVPYYIVGVAQLTFLFGVGALGFGMQVAGSILALVLLSLAVVLCAVCLGLLFAAVGTTEKQLGGIGSVVLLVMGLLGGCMLPRIVMPDFMRSLGHVVPHAWALDGYYDVLVRQGTSVTDIAPSIGALLGFAAVFAGLGLWRFRFER